LQGYFQISMSKRGFLDGETWCVRGELCGWVWWEIEREKYANFLKYFLNFLRGRVKTICESIAAVGASLNFGRKNFSLKQSSTRQTYAALAPITDF
jgi:hypothetical protein